MTVLLFLAFALLLAEVSRLLAYRSAGFQIGIPHGYGARPSFGIETPAAPHVGDSRDRLPRRSVAITGEEAVFPK